MAKTPFISHTVNGYSRYDIPENVAFTATAGILYPVRCSFMNARDVQYIQTGAVVRTDPIAVPTFTPFRVHLHRFFVPLQLYHAKMRVNGSKFDFATMDTNCFFVGNYSPVANTDADGVENEAVNYEDPRSLVCFLGLRSGVRSENVGGTVLPAGEFSVGDAPRLGHHWVNADPIIAYYDIVRSYYSFSQAGDLSLAFLTPANMVNNSTYSLPLPVRDGTITSPVSSIDEINLTGLFNDNAVGLWRQTLANLPIFDDYFERSFYPKDDLLYHDQTARLISTILKSIRPGQAWGSYDLSSYAYTVKYTKFTSFSRVGDPSEVSRAYSLYSFSNQYLPFGVLTSNADRLSRFVPNEATDDVSIDGIFTVKQLALATKTQAYKDLLSSGGSRFSDWLETFFAAKIQHVDRPILVYSSSFYLNSSPIFNQSGTGTLGDYGGVVQGQDSFGKKSQRYCFDEPGYLIDILSVRPLYYWAGIQMDYARYDKLDYFNPVFNEVGYQDVPSCIYGGTQTEVYTAAAQEPCYNEFRASFDRVLGGMALVPGLPSTKQPQAILPLWVQQRAAIGSGNADIEFDFMGNTFVNASRFVDVAQSNKLFSTNTEDHFFINLYYRIGSKSLVSKNFATNLATR